MWLSKQGRTPPRPEETARVGRATLPDDPAGVWTGSERRDVAVFGPGGYTWRPAAGEEVLVLKAGEEACLAGVRCTGVPEPGEVWITGPGGSAIRLKSGGVVDITGTALCFNGAVLAGEVE